MRLRIRHVFACYRYSCLVAERSTDYYESTCRTISPIVTEIPQHSSRDSALQPTQMDNPHILPIQRADHATIGP